MGAFSDPFDPNTILWSGCPCGQHRSMAEHQAAMSRSAGSRFVCESSDAKPTASAAPPVATPIDEAKPSYDDTDALLGRCVEQAVMKGIFGTDVNRRSFLRAVGSGTALAAISQIFPMGVAKALASETKGALEKTKLNVGFVPITCATPIIMAHPMGFYEKYGLDVDVIKTAGWAVSRDKSLSGEYDAAHMLTPMPLAITMGAGSVATPWTMPAVENINGQAITLHLKHKDKRDPMYGPAAVRK